ncbi:hypothetical protein OG204_29940 [Streptomyces sp. NBC_01387]|uniref:hypothetical protein n=1 Tax=unclassified Streptomyces TaxID=2593676 RepID=UPI00225418C7|nr:hypothetical protein [Streptomyces sp. NBC_01500]MCX4547413.1 hypothetical protein [Streptomyces sp. NBC_01500]
MTVYGRAIDLLRAQPALADVAAYPFEFDLSRAEHVEAVRLASGASLEPVAGDGTGGTYFVCGGGPVLYASSEGEAGLIGDSLDEALEVLVGLPGWHGLLHLSPTADADQLLAAVAGAEAEIRAYIPDLDTRRAELRAALGFPARSPVELITRLHTALLRTEPDHLLLNSAEGPAYARLDPHPRPPLRETVLAAGRADLALLRESTAGWADAEQDGGRRAAVLRAAQFDRQDRDLPLLRRLLAAEAADPERSEELRLAAVLVALHGRAGDLPLLGQVRTAKPALRWGPDGFPERPEALAEWARGVDGALYGEDPAREPELTWIRLAARQGRTEAARVALLRILDDTGPQADLLRALSVELEALGDHFQAARAQSGYASLQDRPWDRASAYRRLAGLQRRSGDPAGAWETLRRVPEILDAEGSDRPWRRLGLGTLVTAESFEIALAAAGAGLATVATEALAVAGELHAGMSKSAHRNLGMLAQEAKWAVARLK